MFKFRAVYDNLVTDDVIEEIFEETNITEASLLAWKHSQNSGVSDGNFDLYIELGGNWIDTITVLEAVGETEDGE